MDIEQRLSPKRRQSEEADGDSDRLFVRERQEHQCAGVVAEHRWQAIADVFGQGPAAAHRVRGVGIEHFEHAARVERIGKVGCSNAKVHVLPLSPGGAPAIGSDSKVCT